MYTLLMVYINFYVIYYYVIVLNTRVLILCRWRHFRYGDQALVLPRWDVLDAETKHICEQFMSYHMDKCMRDLVRDRR